MDHRNRHQSSSPRPSDSRSLFAASSAASDFHLAASADPIAFDPSLEFASSQALFTDQSFSAAVDPVVIGLDQPSFSGLGFNTSSGLNDTSFDTPLFSSSADDRSYPDSSVLDPALLGSQVPQQSLSAAAPLNSMATLAPTLHRFDGSPHGSPALNHGPFQPPYVSHSRNSSLDPSSAAFPPLSNAEWGAAAFQGHRRTLSDAHSDVSSTHQSPYMQASDNFDHQLDRSSLPTQDPGMFQEVLAIGHVSLSDRPNAYTTPSHSPRISPQLMPASSPQNYPPIENYDVVANMTPQMPNMFEDPNMYNNPDNHPPPFDTQVLLRSVQPAQSEVMTPPEINIQLAPPSRQASFEPQKDGFQAQGPGLIPPERGMLTNHAKFVSNSVSSRSLQLRSVRGPAIDPGQRHAVAARRWRRLPVAIPLGPQPALVHVIDAQPRLHPGSRRPHPAGLEPVRRRRA
jgi:hypothetical protein